jgi:hypothetical protein
MAKGRKNLRSAARDRHRYRVVHDKLTTAVKTSARRAKLPKNAVRASIVGPVLVTNHGKCSAAVVHSLKGGKFAVQGRAGVHTDRKLYKTPKAAATAATKLVKRCRLNLKKRSR